ncbi:hydantoinase/oxoprolinase family protein, partial [Thermodesulfobacteriota bacterium]
RAVFSTTMATNAIVMDELDPVGMIVSAGPGIHPAHFAVGPQYHVVPGCLDHRGMEVVPLHRESVLNAAASMQKNGVRLAGIVGKFSVRNPIHELQAFQWVEKVFDYNALGHRFSGTLNFPRRIATTYLNAALHDIHRRFASSLADSLTRKGLEAPRYLLKPDGGTVLLRPSHAFPARTAQSGPAASVMGALALDGCAGTCLVLDVGGTTTDMAVVIDGVPLFVPQGITIGVFRTSIRSLLTRSIGVGGDSEVRVTRDNILRVGPLRRGAPAALGGPCPTPTDAFITLGRMPLGDWEKAGKAMESVGGPLGWDPETTAHRVLQAMAETIAMSARAFVHAINERPAYTVYEVLWGTLIVPDTIVVLGGPAEMIAPYLADAFKLPFRVPRHCEVANAVGAAAARVTCEVSLQADSQRGTVIIPEAGVEQQVRQSFDTQDALALARQAFEKMAMEENADTLDSAITEKQEFTMVRGTYRVERNIRLKLSMIPGLIREWGGKEGGIC